MSATERWFWIPDVVLHTENDGVTALKRGLEASDTAMTWQEACARYPTSARKLLCEMQADLDSKFRGERHDRHS